MSTTSEYLVELRRSTAQLERAHRVIRTLEKQQWSGIEQHAYAMIDLFAAYDARKRV